MARRLSFPVLLRGLHQGDCVNRQFRHSRLGSGRRRRFVGVEFGRHGQGELVVVFQRLLIDRHEPCDDDIRLSLSLGRLSVSAGNCCRGIDALGAVAVVVERSLVGSAATPNCLFGSICLANSPTPLATCNSSTAKILVRRAVSTQETTAVSIARLGEGSDRDTSLAYFDIFSERRIGKI